MEARRPYVQQVSRRRQRRQGDEVSTNEEGGLLHAMYNGHFVYIYIYVWCLSCCAKFN